MRAYKKYSRGFTLVELMIVVAIIGVLAALAIYGVRRYLQSAKTSEAKQSIGAIVRGGISAYERETTSQQLVAEGSTSTAFSHDVCSGATSAVPTAIASVAGTKYQPNSTPGSDYETGSSTGGWKCLKFTMTSPSYFQYGYQGTRATMGVTDVIGQAPADPAGGALAGKAPAANNFLAWANGNLDGDTSFSGFGQVANVNTTTRAIRSATQIETLDEFE